VDVSAGPTKPAAHTDIALRHWHTPIILTKLSNLTGL
jgi:hypothetical protein